MGNKASGTSTVTIQDCREAIRLAESELLRLRAELVEMEATVAEQRRAYRLSRKGLARIRRRLGHRKRQLEAMRELVRSGSANGLVDVGETVESAPAGVVLLERLGEMLAETDPGSEAGLRAFFQRLADLQEFAKDFFDYAGVRLVYELGELLDQANEAEAAELDALFHRVSELRTQSEQWFVGS